MGLRSLSDTLKDFFAWPSDRLSDIVKEVNYMGLTNVDYKSIAKGAIMAAVGAGATYLLQVVGKMDFGTYTPFVAALLAVVSNAVHKFVW